MLDPYVFIFVVIISFLLIVVFTLLFKKPKQLPLINLKEYEKELLYQAANGIPLMPVPPVPHIVGRQYSDNEIALIDINRKEAVKIYQKIERMRYRID